MPTPLKLDIHKFRKVRALMDRGSTDGERQAARSRAVAMAAKAGMKLEAALKEDDRLSKKTASWSRSSSSADMAREWADRQEREQDAQRRAEEARWEAFHAAEKEKRRARFAEAVSKFGPAEPIFAETPEEIRLRTFLEPYETFAKLSNGEGTYHDGYSGWGSKYPEESQLLFRKVLNEAMPLPSSLPSLIAEWNSWEMLVERRCAYEYEYQPHRSINVRTNILEELITSTPIRGWADMEARLGWLRAELDRDRWRSRENDMAEFERLKADFEILRAMATQPISQSDPQGLDSMDSHVGGRHDENPDDQSERAHNGQSHIGHRTNADKAATVRGLLKERPDLSDRAIGRMAGVSPQTVGNWRKRLNRNDQAAA